MPPKIIALTGDYFLIPRIEDVAADLNFHVEVVASASDLGAEGMPLSREIPLTEPTEGSDGAFMRAIVDHRPALILVDLSSQEIPWRRWIQILKTSAATRRIPIVAFGPHVEKGTLEAAEKAGADEVVSRGKFQASISDLIRTNARIVDIADACQGELSELASQGLNLLNAGHYYEAHEPLEEAWMQAPELEGYLYRVMLQISIAYLQVERSNFKGALKMVLRMNQWLDPLPDSCRGVDVAEVRSNIEAFASALEAAGPEGMSTLHEHLRPIPLLD